MTEPNETGTPPPSNVAELELRAVLDAAVDAVIVIDAAGRIETFSHGAERLFGYAAAEVIGRNVTVLMPEPFRSHHDGYLAHHIRSGERRIIGKGREVVAQRRDGSLFPVFLSVGRIAAVDTTDFPTSLNSVQLRVLVILSAVASCTGITAPAATNKRASIRAIIRSGSGSKRDSSDLL